MKYFFDADQRFNTYMLELNPTHLGMGKMGGSKCVIFVSKNLFSFMN